MNESTVSGPALPDSDILPDDFKTPTEPEKSPETPPPTEPEKTPEAEPVLSPKKTRELAAQVWAMIIQLMAAVFGPQMLPRKYVVEGADITKGELPYDENGMVIDAWADYLSSLGLSVFSPLVNLWLAMLGYFLPRLTFIIIRVKSWFGKGQPMRTAAQPSTSSPQAQPGQAPQQPGQPPRTQSTPPPNPQPAARPAAPAQSWQQAEWIDV